MTSVDFSGYLAHRPVCGGRLSLRPMHLFSTPALSVTWTSPLQLRYAARGALQVLYAFALIFCVSSSNLCHSIETTIVHFSLLCFYCVYVNLAILTIWFVMLC